MASKTKGKKDETQDEVTTEPTREEEEAVRDEARQSIAEKRTRKPGPTYALTKLDTLPENVKTERTSRQVYMELLQPIVEDEDNWGEWFQVAEFNTASGAKDAAKQIKAGKRDVPGGEWEFEYRRLQRDDGEKYSILAARYLGN